MSIRNEIVRLVQQGELFHLRPLLRGAAVVRYVFVSKDVFSVVNDPHASTDFAWHYAQFRATLDNFTENGRITVRERPRKKANHATLARTDPPHDEVWDIRVIEPHPGIRALGRFSELNTFIVLIWDFRENIENEEQWLAFIERCKSEWRRVFGTCLPFYGKKLDDYLSNFTAV